MKAQCDTVTGTSSARRHLFGTQNPLGYCHNAFTALYQSRRNVRAPRELRSVIFDVSGCGEAGAGASALEIYASGPLSLYHPSSACIPSEASS